ncbi:MAG: DOMON-like domain-containing protein [Rhodocyclaceae bacterium]|nr:DOMON-like domain-containing protein [Rhodocyclaceae bacterium]
MATYSLICHPASPCTAVSALEVSVHAGAGGRLTLAYRLSGDMAGLLLPEPAPPGPADGLWRHTCFEAFVAVSGAPAYREFNFSPSGQWAAYGFSDTRQREESFVPSAAPDIALRRFPDRLELDATLPPELLPGRTTLQLGLSAVIEAAGGSLSYWALAHPAEKPDFHLRAGFTARLPLGPEIHRANEFAPTSP